MTDNIYTEHANITTLYDREVEKNRKLTILNQVLFVILLVIFVFNVFAFVWSYRTVMTYESVCPACNYNLCLPEPVATPIQK